jgi:hypothetical protein
MGEYQRYEYSDMERKHILDDYFFLPSYTIISQIVNLILSVSISNHSADFQLSSSMRNDVNLGTQSGIQEKLLLSDSNLVS